MSARKLPETVENLPSVLETLVFGLFLGPGKGSYDLQQPSFLHNDWLSERWPQELTSPGTTQACQISEDLPRREQGVCAVWKVLCGFMKRAHLQQNVETTL